MEIISIPTCGQGLYEITDRALGIVSNSDVEQGLCNFFVQHTSASLTIQENADPSAKRDLEAWMSREVPENHPDYTHTYEGSDDMPAHIKSVISGCSVSVPVEHGRLLLGTWQGLYLWEHRNGRHSRKVVVTIIST